MSKKLSLVLLSFALVLTLTACAVQNKPVTDNPSSSKTQSEIQSTPTDSTTNTTQNNTAKITEAKAKDIALKHANLTADKVTELEIELDTDDAVTHYDVDFKANGYEYDYEIQAETGEILKSEKEIDD